MINLGVEAKDKVTGFQGIVTSRHTYITGCDQYTLSPPKKEDGSLCDNYQFDEGRIEIIGKGINKEEITSKKKGGPQAPSLPSK